jgi:hypothetical protein
MGRIDRLKALQPRVLDRLTPQRVVFHHVPKCGGTSVGRALRKRYLLSQATVTPEASFRAFEAFTGRSDADRDGRRGHAHEQSGPHVDAAASDDGIETDRSEVISQGRERDDEGHERERIRR